MDSLTIEQTYEPKRSRFVPLLTRIGDALLRVGRSPVRLDLECLPDHIKRDLGFLDGREPHYDLDLLR
ncbi:hypothetical protein MRS76_02370 [Rhizobiaceae bacterium n13]|uniref:hypothetical protein n=1 Tax=Ferirhizobium litorale TaxID=2927786 RepID=UPI0024B2F92C|nr:hypothetical protein [Fererhizobium litorale]MDI7860788.1 hypothetical protein [Fererhizobium litorale]